MRFITPIYHPNIDEAGRICADILKMPPAGNWVPALNLSTVLLALSGLMSEPNPEDPLEMDIAAEYKENIALFRQKAQQMTLKYAIKGLHTTPASSSSQTSTTPLLPGADSPRFSHTATTSEISSIGQDSTSESVNPPVNRSKKLSKLSLSKRKAEDSREPKFEKEPNGMKNSTLNITRQPTTSKYFKSASMAVTTTSSNSSEAVNKPLSNDGETLPPIITNNTIHNNNQSDSQPANFEQDKARQLSELSSQHDHDGPPPVDDQITPRSKLVQDSNTLSPSQTEASSHYSDKICSVDNLYTTHSPTSICTTTPQPLSSANTIASAIKEDANLASINNRIETNTNTIILDAPVSRKRALLSLGKSKKLKM
ncbi:unnamed protein product [Umbelopsis ramanniana]